MAEFEEKLNSILGNQEAMGQIMALARSLSSEGKGKTGQAAGEEAGEGEDAPEGVREDRPPDLSQLLAGVDPGMVEMGLRLFQEYQGTDDRRTALLQALRPFLREERQAKLDQAVRIARLTRIIRAVLGTIGEKGDEEGV